MCGPLVLALPVQQMSASGRTWSIGLYHGGRIAVYAMGGLLFGLLGRRLYLAGWQQGLSIVLGALILSRVLFQRLRGRGVTRMPAIALSFYNTLQRWMTPLWQSPAPGKFVLMGMGNGLLPCGMVYLAVAAALTAEHIGLAIGFMIFFGLGTMPMLLVLQATGRLVSLSIRQQIRRSLPYLTAFMAILLILRGMNLGIPFISPIMAARPGQVISCH
jgi:uncharacterized protein